MALNKPAEYGEGVSSRLRSWIISTANRLFYQQEYQALVDIPSISAGGRAAVDITLSGVKVDDIAAMVKFSTDLPTGVVFSHCRIPSDKTIRLIFGNLSASPSSLAQVSTTFLVSKRQ